MLDYEKQERGDVTVFSLKGNLDALTAPSLKKEIEALMSARKINVVFDLSGLELIEMIRADDQLNRVPIMAVTAYAAQGDEERITAAGAQAYVSKPISVMRFAETVDELLERGLVGEAEDVAQRHPGLDPGPA